MLLHRELAGSNSEFLHLNSMRDRAPIVRPFRFSGTIRWIDRPYVTPISVTSWLRNKGHYLRI
jgi:hypothetical protein